jgi:hypothetical protein
MTPKICSGLPEIINQYVQLAHWVPVVWATKYKFPEAQLQYLIFMVFSFIVNILSEKQ